MSSFYNERKTFDTLSEEQLAAAMETDNPVLIVAGAGAGKTKTLIARATKILLPKDEGGLGADPSSLMMVTFTNKAGKEMRERFVGVLDALKDAGIYGEPWIGTFHSISMRILRIEAKHAGYGNNFTIIDDSDAKDVVKEAAEELKLEQFDIDEFFSNLEYAKARLLTPDLILTKKQEIQGMLNEKRALTPVLERWNRVINGVFSNDFPNLYKKYQEVLSRNNSVDFSDLINQVTLLFRSNHKIRDSWRSTFRHFMVDEAQDMNPAQAAWFAELTGKGAETVLEAGYDEGMAFDDATSGKHHVNTHRVRQFPRPTIAFVGDDDQAIYAFRGSDSEIMRGFEKSYENLSVKYLTKSYRCQPNVLSVANRLISNNDNRYDKTVVAADQSRTGEAVVWREYQTHEDEFRALAKDVKDHIEKGGMPFDYGVLLRTRNGVKDVAKYLREQGIPVTEGKASDIRKSAEVRDVMAYAGFLVNPDAEILLRRIINKPSRGMGATSTASVTANAKMKNIGFTEELRSVMNGRIDLPDGAKPYPKAFIQACKSFGYQIVTMRNKAAGLPADQALGVILRDSGYLDMLMDDVIKATGAAKKLDVNSLKAMPVREFMNAIIKFKGIADPEKMGMEDAADEAGNISEGMRRIANIALLLDQASGVESLIDFVQDSALEMSTNKEAPGVNVMTMHSAKGLEFDKVWSPLWYKGMMPLSDDPQEMAEEMNLGYVTITRAINNLTISSPRRVMGARFAMGKGGNTTESPFKSMMTSPEMGDIIHFNPWGKRAGDNPRVQPGRVSHQPRTEKPQNDNAFLNAWGKKPAEEKVMNTQAPTETVSVDFDDVPF